MFSRAYKVVINKQKSKRKFKGKPKTAKHHKQNNATGKLTLDLKFNRIWSALDPSLNYRLITWFECVHMKCLSQHQSRRLCLPQATGDTKIIY